MVVFVAGVLVLIGVITLGVFVVTGDVTGVIIGVIGGVVFVVTGEVTGVTTGVIVVIVVGFD